MCTLIGTLHPRDFLRKHQFGLLTILVQTHFSSPSFSLFVIDKIQFFFWTWIHCLRFLKSLLWDTDILSLRQSGKGKVVHEGSCDSCRNWNDEADAAITKTQRCSETYWWKGKSLGFSALKGFCVLKLWVPDEGCSLVSSPLACSVPCTSAAVQRSRELDWRQRAVDFKPDQ